MERERKRKIRKEERKPLGISRVEERKKCMSLQENKGLKEKPKAVLKNSKFREKYI